MKNRKKIFVFLSLVIVSYGLYFLFNKKNSSPNIEFSKALEGYPAVVVEAVNSGKVDPSEYKSTIASIGISDEDHARLGESLYTLAMGSAFYSDKKITLLKMAKEHLLLSKTGSK